jgi:GT2 family glycosyltransferase
MTGASYMPNVSVLVLNYNGKQHLKPCLDSLFHLDYPRERLEIVVADNGSRDGSQELLRREFPSVRLVEHGRNLGVSGGNNAASAAVDSEYVAFLNNDTRVEPDWLSQMVKALAPDQGLIAVGSKILRWDGRRIDYVGPRLSFHGAASQVDFGSPEVEKYRQVMPILAPCGGSMLIERQTFLEVGGFDQDFFAYFEDIDLGWRLWVMGYQVALAPRAITYHRQHGSWGQRAMEIRRRVLYERNSLYSIIKNYEEQNLQRILPVALLLTAKRALLYTHLDLAPYRPPGVEPPVRETEATLAPQLAQETTLSAKLRRSWREGGLKGAATKILERLSTTVLTRIAQGLPWVDTELVSKTAICHLVALDDVAENMDKMLAKRARIQAARRRPDAEIVPLFQEPFWPVYKDAEYLRTVARLAHDLGIETIFE